MKGRAQIALQRGAHILQHRHVRKHRRDLKRAHDATARRLCRFFGRDIDAVEADAAAAGVQKLGQQIEERGFASTIGADQRVDMAAPDFQVNLVDRHESLEFFGQSTRFQYEFR